MVVDVADQEANVGWQIEGGGRRVSDRGADLGWQMGKISI